MKHIFLLAQQAVIKSSYAPKCVREKYEVKTLHKEDANWVGDFNAFVKQAFPNFADKLKAGDVIFTRDDVKNLMTVSRKELLERIAELERENAALKKRLIELGDISPF